MAATSTVAILPTAETTFFDDNGVPLALGSVTFYIPSTSTPKDTWQNSAGTILNTNPVALDAAGRAIIWGFGSYRQLVKDALGNTIWDQVTNYTVPTGTLVNIRAISGTGTYTPTAGTAAIYVIVCGGGGGGGGAAATSASQIAVGAGGGAGGYASSYLTSAFSGVTVTIGAAGAAGATGANAGGAGGTTSFGSLLSATGGNGGSAGTTVSTASLPNYAFGGGGGVGSSGNLVANATGGAGNDGLYLIAAAVGSNNGGTSFFNVGGAGTATATGRAGIVGGYGSGGSGGCNTISQATARAGGAGGSGFVQIWEYS